MYINRLTRLLTLFFLLPSSLSAQGIYQEYYLPRLTYNSAIPTPASWLGYEVGQWHTSHDQLIGYMKALDAASDRITLMEYGRSHENRPLICLTITDPANHAKLEDIKTERAKLVSPAESRQLNLKNMPAVNYMGYSIHGNETSGSHAALLVAYYLAAAQTKEVEELLRNTVILFDPCFNPDGMQRFSSWVNSRKSKNPSADPAGDEYNEPWPRGRTNHYGFDLNRDWLVSQQPESVGRVKIFQEWHPNVLTDHHEMDSGSTFFFQPGVPSRVNPITPVKNQQLTAKIAEYHAKALSQKQVLFYTGENFDDFYYGKGSTYPDVNGGIGILFEQASSRGTQQETKNGLLTFPYSIRNQVITSLSTLKAVGEMRIELNDYLRDFYTSALEEARKSSVKGYVFDFGNETECTSWDPKPNNFGYDVTDELPCIAFLQMLRRHKISFYQLGKDFNTTEGVFSARSFFVPLEQPQYRLIRSMFERPTQFQDSIFYDISAWTLPDAFGLHWAAVSGKVPDAHMEPQWQEEHAPLTDLSRIYAFVFPNPGYEMPRLLYRLQKEGYRVHVAMEPFEAEGQQFAAGSLVIPADRQTLKVEAGLDLTVNERFDEPRFSGLVALKNGLTAGGPDLGSSKFPVVRMPKVLMLTGNGVNIADAGEIWHLLDIRYNMPLTMMDADRFNGANLETYNVLVLPDGNYGSVSADKVKAFVQNGGTIVATGNALRWLKTAGLAALEFRNLPEDANKRRPYSQIAEDRGARNMPGAIFEAELDLTHPLCFGYSRPKLPVFLTETLFVETAKNPYATPAVLTQNPLLAGYIHAQQKPLASGAAAAVVCGQGKGKIICFPGNPNFRAFWYGTNRLFANAIFFGNLINSDGVERK